MADSKRYYWIKLKESFLTSDTVDFLMSQKNGANYVVLYQMLCLKCANTDGELKREIGEIIIPYDEHKIQRDCKYFDLDTVIVALGLYKQLGLVYIQDDGYLKIANFNNLIGSESESAERVRRFRDKKEVEKLPLQCNAQCNTTGNENVTVDKENRDSLLSILKNKLSSAGAYMGVHDGLIDEVVEALVAGCGLSGTVTFGGKHYTAATFQRIADKLDVEQVAFVVNRLLNRRDEIDNRTQYILSVFATKYGLAEDER